MTMPRCLTLALAAALAPLTAQESESKDPPAGAPWTKDFLAACRTAAEQGKPVFVYSTKTY